MIQILLADDSPLSRGIFREIISSQADMRVAGEAENGRDAVELTARLRPDIVVMDAMMPVMGGLEAVEEIMALVPTPILVLSSTLDDTEVGLAFKAIQKGALDVMKKPSPCAEGNLCGFSATLIDKIRLLSRIKVIRHRRTPQGEKGLRRELPKCAKTILAIGASTGGPRAVAGILRELPADFGGAVFVVQHISHGFAPGFAHWLTKESLLPVKLADEGDEIRPGRVLVAPGEKHMLLENGTVRLSDGQPVNSCRPSIDVFFSSLADADPERTLGVLLTGMGKDGARGLSLLRKNGGATIVQNEESCTIFGMPKAAIAMGAAEQVLPLSRIAEAVCSVFKK